MKTSYVNEYQNWMAWRMHKQSWHLDEFVSNFWTKIVFGCNSDNFRGCLIKYYAWSMCLFNRVHPSMFVRECFSHQPLKDLDTAFLSSSTFFHQNGRKFTQNITLIKTPIFFWSRCHLCEWISPFRSKIQFNT